MNNQPIIIEKTYNAPIAKVWTAITDLDHMKKWYFDIAEFKAVPSFEFSFEGGSETRKYLHKCQVQEVIPGRKISYTWRYEGYPGDSLVSFELFDEGDKTRLKLTHSGIETFAANGPDFAVSSFTQGWTFITGTSLKDFLEKTTAV